MSLTKSAGGRKLNGSIIHAGHEHHAGEPCPDGVDMERMERLGLVGKQREGDHPPPSRQSSL